MSTMLDYLEWEREEHDRRSRFVPVFYPQSEVDEMVWKKNPLTAFIPKPEPFFGVER